MYKPPNTNSDNHNVFLNNIKIRLQHSGKKKVFGDMNLNLADPDRIQYTSYTRFKFYKDVWQPYFLIINKPMCFS